MTDERQNERRCKGVIVGVKSNEPGRPCKKWAQRGSDYCKSHDGTETRLPFNRTGVHEHRCIARSKRTGTQCKRTALPGLNVCRTHGGGSKAAIAKSRAYLDQLAEPAIFQLQQILNDSKTAAPDRLRAIQMVLDRTGFGKRESLDVEVEMKPWEVTMGMIIKEIPADMRTESIGPSTELDMIDAEVVEEDYNPRDELPQIRPNSGPDGRAAVHMPNRIGSADPPRRSRDR